MIWTTGKLDKTSLSITVIEDLLRRTAFLAILLGWKLHVAWSLACCCPWKLAPELV
jgi:hypothetical protein